MAGYGAKEARYNTRLAKQTRGQVNLCGACGAELAATELLCKECRGTLGPNAEGVSDESPAGE
jgi:predicted amidophosphoribosyltransferase